MLLANIIFGAKNQQCPEDLEDVAIGYLCSLKRNGQIGDELITAWSHGRLNAYVQLAGRSAMLPRYHSAHGKACLKKVVEGFGVPPEVRIIDDGNDHRESTWNGAPFLYLYTHAFDDRSPVCRGDGKPLIPFFKLPLNDQLKEEIYRWQQRYILHDGLWFESGALEVAAYRQTADPKSELAVQGRDLCKEIEVVTGVPTYYYLTRYWGRSKGEGQRLCPGCGSEWKFKPLPTKRDGFWKFDFKCDRCRLVSHEGVSSDGGRHVKIGEFQRSPSRSK